MTGLDAGNPALLRSPPDRWAIFVVLVNSRGTGRWADTLQTGSAVSGSVLPTPYSRLRRSRSNVLHSGKHIYKKLHGHRGFAQVTPLRYTQNSSTKRKRVVCQPNWDRLVSACVPQTETGEQDLRSGLDSGVLICVDFRRDPRAVYVSDRGVGLSPQRARSRPSLVHQSNPIPIRRGGTIMRILVVAIHLRPIFPAWESSWLVLRRGGWFAIQTEGT